MTMHIRLKILSLITFTATLGVLAIATSAMLAAAPLPQALTNMATTSSPEAEGTGLLVRIQQKRTRKGNARPTRSRNRRATQRNRSSGQPRRQTRRTNQPRRTTTQDLLQNDGY